jgi:hypothetical protein
VIVHEREQSRQPDRGFEIDTSAGDVEIGR